MSRRTHALLLAPIIALLIACGGGAAARPTATAAPTMTPAPPTPTLEPAARYEQIARDAARPLDTRAAVGLPAGVWTVSTLLPGEVQIIYPMTAGMDTAQTARQGQRQIAAIVKALFDSTDLTRVNVIGTLPLADSEAPAISAALTREEYTAWSGKADELPGMQIGQRLR